ncbi:hypothetical protein EHJ26_RS28135, partial [Escherichia coli]
RLMATYGGQFTLTVNPPRVDVFHGTPPAWSSFGNKTIWGGNEWVDDSPTRSDIEKRDKEITAYKNTLSADESPNDFYQNH